MRKFEGKTAVITGGASGLGRAFAERFAREGTNVVLGDIEEEALNRAVAEFRQQERNVIGVVTNTMSRESVERLAERATAEFGPVHLLFNNAGVIGGAAGQPIWATPTADWEWIMGVNFWGVLHGVQAFLPGMVAHGEEGHVVNTASVAALIPGNGIYGVSKHAVLALTECLQRDLRASGSKISASVLCPGFVRTNLDQAARNRPAELSADVAPATAAPGTGLIGGGIDPSDVAEAVYEAVANDRFYILPHPAWDPIIRDRFEHILGRAQPLTVDFLEMRRRQEAGERF